MAGDVHGIAIGSSGVDDDEWVRRDVERLTGRPFAQADVEPRRVALTDLADAQGGAEGYLLDGDEDGYECVLGLADAYAAGATLPPLLARSTAEGLEVIDGFHRLAAAREAGLDTIDVCVLVERPLLAELDQTAVAHSPLAAPTMER